MNIKQFNNGINIILVLCCIVLSYVLQIFTDDLNSKLLGIAIVLLSIILLKVYQEWILNWNEEKKSYTEYYHMSEKTLDIEWFFDIVIEK